MNTFTKRKSGRPRAAAPKSRQESKERTRARILEVAKAQLESHGYEATNIRGVAKAAGVATGTVLLHFTDKRDLLHAALFDDLERTWRVARANLSQRTLEHGLTALARAFFGYYAARPALSRALLRESLFAEPPWNARFAAQVAAVHTEVAALAERAKTRGELAANADANVLGASFFSFYYFALLAWLQGGLPAPEGLFVAMLRPHLAGLAPSKVPQTKKKAGK